MNRRQLLATSIAALLATSARAHGFDAEDDADAAERWTRERRFQATPYGRTA